jgi:hypothetical protein
MDRSKQKGGGELIPPLSALWPSEQWPAQVGRLRLVELAPDAMIRIQHLVHDALWIVQGGQGFVTGPLRLHNLIMSVATSVLLAPFFRRQP